MKIEGWRARWLVAVGFRLFQLLVRSLHFEIDDRANLRNASSSERYIGALWHNRLLLIPFVVWRFLPNRRGGAALISASRDGALIADLVERFTFQAVRGSSSRRGRSWDRFIVPYPFSTVRVIFGTPHRVALTSTDQEFESERLRLQNAMMALVEMR